MNEVSNHKASSDSVSSTTPLPKTPLRVLFICHFNAIRSPIAQGLLQNHLGESAVVRSCGIRDSDLDDYMVMVMRERNIDLSSHEYMSLSHCKGKHFDRIIAMTDEVKQAAESIFEAQTIELWPVPDPIIGSLDVRALLNNYRSVRDLISQKIQTEFKLGE